MTGAPVSSATSAAAPTWSGWKWVTKIRATSAPSSDSRPDLLRVGQADPGVDERPAVVARQQVRVDVPGPRRQRQRDRGGSRRRLAPSRAIQHASRDTNICSILRAMRVEYREEPCRSALNRVKGMPFAWSLNPYMGCVHRCTFCYVRAFEQRADRPSDDRYGRSIRVKVERRRGARARARAPLVAARARSRSAPRPTRTSPPRAATG